MGIYSVTIGADTGKVQAGTQVSAATDWFVIQAPFNDTGKGSDTGLYLGMASDLRIREIRIGQYSDPPVALGEEILSVRVIVFNGDTGEGGDTGNTVMDTGSGQRVFPVSLDMRRKGSGPTGADDTGSAIRCLVLDTGMADTGIATSAALTKVVVQDSWNIAAGWWWYPPEEEMIVLRSKDTLAVRVSAPADALTITGTMIFETIGVNR